MMEPIVVGFQVCWADIFSDFLGWEISSWLEYRHTRFGLHFLPFIRGGL